MNFSPMAMTTHPRPKIKKHLSEIFDKKVKEEPWKLMNHPET